MCRSEPWQFLLVLQLVGFSASIGPPRLVGQATQVVTARVSSVIKLPCPVEAEPAALMQWFKDKYLIHQGWERFKVTQKWLKIKEIVMEDAGLYVCKAINGFGSVSINVTLRVVDGSSSVKKHNLFAQTPEEDHKTGLEKIKTKPEILPPHPMNITVKYGSTASFQCRVKSVVQPHIQWLKRVEEHGDQVNQNTTIVVKGHRFIVLETGSVLHTTDGAYLNKLVIPHATEDSAGMYICLGANSMGYSYREAFLIVSTDRSQQRASVPSGGSSSGSSLPLVIALPSVLGFVLIGVVIYLIQEKQKGCNSRSPAAQRFPVPTHDKDVYPAVHNPHMYPVTHNVAREKFSKPYSAVDYYTDISSASRSHPSHHQHQHTHYNY